MLKRFSIPHSDLMVSAMCLGCTAFGTGLPESTTERLYAAFRESGGNCFDTAHCYCFWLPGGAGASERALGECVRRHHDEKNVLVISKGGHPSAAPGYVRSEHYLSPEVLDSDIAES